MIRPFIINKNPVELKYYPFMISLDNCNENCNSVNNLPLRICVLVERSDANIEVFNMITNRTEAKHE